MQGWIKDYRKEVTSDIWMMPPLYHRVWQYLKYDVNHQDKTVPTKTGKITVKKGQTITSYQRIAEKVAWYEWGVEKVPNKKTIKAILDWLEQAEMIVRESNAKGTLITICNYCEYQGAENGESNAKETQKKRYLDTNKNVKNVKNEKKEIYSENVSMTNEQYDKLIERFGEKSVKDKIENLNLYKASTGKKYKCDYSTILAWDRKDNTAKKKTGMEVM